MIARLLLLLLASLTLLAAGESTPHLSAYYYPWYSHDRHWHEGYLAEEGDPALGNYSSRTPSVIRQHLEWSRNGDIDNWVCSWWGPGSWEDDTLRRYIAPVISTENNPENPTLCVFYEAEGILGMDPERGIVFDEKTTDQFVEDFGYLAETYFDLPSYYRIDGKPVVYIYLSRTFAGDYASAIARVRAKVRSLGHEVFLIGDEVYWGDPEENRVALWDAVTAYNLHGPPIFGEQPDQLLFVEECDNLYREWTELCTRLGVKLIPGFIPGFNNHGADPDRTYYTIPRNLKPGAPPTSTLNALADVSLDYADPELNAVVLTSFNEWHEDSQVEPREGTDGSPDLQFLEALKAKFGPR